MTSLRNMFFEHVSSTNSYRKALSDSNLLQTTVKSSQWDFRELIAYLEDLYSINSAVNQRSTNTANSFDRQR